MNGKWVSDKIAAGLELEYEGITYTRVHMKYIEKYGKNRLLSFKEDNSLRPRRLNTEITFAGPMAGEHIEAALDQLKDVLSWFKFRVSWRCGMHVHIDCRGLELSQPYRAAILAALIEPVLYAWDGAGRQENKFCQSIVDSVYSYIPTRVGDKVPAFTKYSLLNLHSLFRYGSLELRFAASTTSLDRITRYINLGMGLREATTWAASGEEVIVSVLQAKSMAHWLEEHTHPLLAEQLIPVVERTKFAGPTVPAMNAALALAEFEKTLVSTTIRG